jgi:hypothetical protein
VAPLEVLGIKNIVLEQFWILTILYSKRLTNFFLIFKFLGNLIKCLEIRAKPNCDFHKLVHSFAVAGEIGPYVDDVNPSRNSIS